MIKIHYALGKWTRTACNLKVTSGITVCSRKESATCERCINNA